MFLDLTVLPEIILYAKRIQGFTECMERVGTCNLAGYDLLTLAKDKM
jgi:hypothetical protein